MSISLRSYLGSHIDVLIEDDSVSKSWRCTGFYGAPQVRREESWQLFCNLNDCSEISWFIIGDFNEILFSFEKQGGILKGEQQMQAFGTVLEDCGLEDLRYKGIWYT